MRERCNVIVSFHQLLFRFGLEILHLHLIVPASRSGTDGKCSRLVSAHLAIVSDVQTDRGVGFRFFRFHAIQVSRLRGRKQQNKSLQIPM